MADAQRLRHAIDTGATRDKVEGPDPAVAPLGTDDEAGGHAPPHDWGSPHKGDRLADGDAPSVGQLYKVRGEEDNRAPATAPPSWRTWAFIALGLLVLGLVIAALAV